MSRTRNFALGEWTFAFKSRGFERGDSVWRMFEEDLLNLKNFTKTNNIDFYVMISPISFDSNHEEMNIYTIIAVCNNRSRENLKKILTKFDQIFRSNKQND